MIKRILKKAIILILDLIYLISLSPLIRWKKGYDNLLKRALKKILILRAKIYYLIISKNKLTEMRNIHKGQRCFIICNGPSLNTLDLKKLKDEVTFGVNSIYLKKHDMDFMPTYYAATDYCVLEDRRVEIEKLVHGIRFLPIEGGYCFKNTEETIWINSPDYCGDLEVPSFSKIPEQYMFHGSTITFTCMQLAYHMGFSKVYLIGCDNNYEKPNSILEDHLNWTSTENDPNHFDPNYFGKGYRWNVPRTDLMERSYKLAQWVYEEDGRALLNATNGGNLECLQRVNYNDLFY